MTKMVCVECELQYRTSRVGVPVIELFGNPPKPYKLWSADVWVCPGCNHEVVGGWSSPHEHFQDGFEQLLDKAHKHPATILIYERAGQPAYRLNQEEHS